MTTQVRIKDFAPTDFEKLTISNAAGGKGVTAAKIGKAVFITVETDQIRYRLDGTAPDSTTGHLVGSGENIYLAEINAITNLLMIRVTGDATIQVTHY